MRGRGALEQRMPGERIDNPIHDFGLVGGLNVDRDPPGLSGLVENPDLEVGSLGAILTLIPIGSTA